MAEPARLILASASPRRAELAALLGRPITVLPVDVDESVRPGEDAAALAERLAVAKATAAARLAAATDQVVGADTVVVVGDHVLGKPTDRADATRMIRSLAGRRHRVVTAVAVVDVAGCRSAVATTDVWFRAMTDDEIAAYVASGEGDDKAGAYGIQGRAGRFVERVEGSWHNVVGLPLTVLEELLATGR